MTVLDSGFYDVDSKYQILDLRFYLSGSRFQKVCFPGVWITRSGFQIPQSNIFWILDFTNVSWVPESGIPYTRITYSLFKADALKLDDSKEID